MPKRKQTAPKQGPKPALAPALTPDGRIKQMTALAMNLVEERIRNGTASAQEVTTILKMGSEHAQLELDKLRVETELAQAKKEAIDAQRDTGEKYVKALEAMRRYNGNSVGSDDYDDEDIHGTN